MREGVYLEKMAEFAALLRHEGLTVGLRETEDMCKILSELDLADRGTVYAVLSSLCAKSREEQAVFRRAFDGFFVSVEQRQALRARHEAEARELAQRRMEAERDLQAGGNPIPLREDLQEVYVRMGEDKREQLRQMLEKTRGNLERNPKLYGNFIRSVFMRFLLEQQMAMEDSAQIAEDIQKKQSQIDNLQAQINALSAKEEKIDSLSGQIEKAIEDINTANFDLETQRIALETLETNHSAQVSKTEANQATQSQIDALTVETLNNAIENAQAEIRSINAELSAAQALLATPALSAKADGVVTLVSYTEGDTVPAGKSVVTIGDSGEKCVAAEIPQEDIGGVELGQAVELQFVANPDNTISGRVVEKNLVPTQGTEGVTYTVKIAFDEPQEELLQGMTCSVKFIQKRVENVLTLANKAITLTDGKQTVIVQMADGSHEEREIKTGFSDGRTSEVTSGLSAGEIVVVAG